MFNANEVREKYESPKEEEINIAETNTSSGGEVSLQEPNHLLHLNQISVRTFTGTFLFIAFLYV